MLVICPCLYNVVLKNFYQQYSIYIFNYIAATAYIYTLYIFEDVLTLC
jgi:hypothetical protein